MMAARGNTAMSITTAIRHRRQQRPLGWLAANAVLALIAILLLTLTVAELEAGWGIVPSDDSATMWVLSGE
jgi:hypothetical protein